MRSISFDADVWADFLFWLPSDRKMARRITRLIGKSNATHSEGSENQNHSQGNCPGIGPGGSTTNIGSCTEHTTAKSRS